MKPAAAPTRTSGNATTASGAARARQGLEPAVLGRSTPKNPAREQARQLARNQGLKPTRSGAQERLERWEVAEPASTGSEPNTRVPSRNSRSMKSRQSEPRVSRTGSKRNSKSAAKSKPPYLLMALAASFVVIGLIVLSRLFAGGTGRTAQDVHIPVNTATTTVSSRAPTAEGTSEPSRIITATVGISQKPAMNLTQPKDIQLSQIAGFNNGIPAVIQFRDGSLMNADPVTLEQLPAEVRLQLTYTRERP